MKESQMKKVSRLLKGMGHFLAHVPVSLSDTSAGRQEGLHEAMALKDYRSDDPIGRRGLKKAA
jgi:hypothetical protein